MDAFVGITGVALIIISISMFIAAKIRKKPIKIPSLIFCLGFILFITGLAMPTSSSQGNVNISNVNGTTTPTTVSTPNITPESTHESTPVPSESSIMKASPESSTEPDPTTVPSESSTPSPDGNKKLRVTFIDVGQADSILIQASSGETMLIDAGNNADGQTVVSYLKNQGIQKIDILVGTHPHEDHIGGMDNVINSFDIGQIYMPKVSHTTKTYEDVLLAISRKGLKVTAPVPGSSLDLGDARVTFLAPNSSTYNDLNNYSIILRMVYDNTAFLFCGDAEAVSETEILAKKYDTKADVLKVGHHGSNSSTTSEFLSAVSPKYAVITVGKDNDYGHPHAEVLNRLNAAGIKIYRTDEVGTIVATSDGETISFDKQSSQIKENAPPTSTPTPTPTLASTPAPVPTNSSVEADNNKSSSGTTDKKEAIVYITNTGEKYHSSGCSYLKSRIPIELSEAKNSGYTPCSRCNPPR